MFFTNTFNENLYFTGENSPVYHIRDERYGLTTKIWSSLYYNVNTGCHRYIFNKIDKRFLRMSNNTSELKLNVRDMFYMDSTL